MIVALLSLLACEPEDEGRVVVEGDYTFSPNGEGTGTCGPVFSELYFVTTSPATVSIVATDSGFEGTSSSFALTELACVGEDDFDCTLYDGTSEASDADVSLVGRATATGEWDGETTLDGTWTLSMSCNGDDCAAEGDAYGFEFPCSWTQPYEASM